MDDVPSLLMALVGLLLVAGGSALAMDFRGSSTWVAKRSAATERTVRKIPPWKWLLRSPEEDLIMKHTFRTRLDGALFVVAGLLLVALALFGHSTSH
jgi:hypothetical protein